MTTMVTGESGDAPQAPAGGSFEVHLDVFEGPFDLLLALISKHKLDITEIALSSVTDEFISYIRALADGWDLDQASYFLVVAATLLDLKAARLLPAGEVDDEEDLALLEARDLLFGLGPAEFAAIAARTLAPKKPPVVSTEHLHTPRTTVREQAELLAGRLRELRRATFRRLTSDCAGTYEVVARFLAVLDHFRDGCVSLDQLTPLGELYVTWTAGDEVGPAAAAVQESATAPARDTATEGGR